MKRCIENVKWTVSELVVSQLHLLERRILVNDDEGASVRRGTERVVDKPRLQHLFCWQQIRNLPHITAGWTVHPPAPYLESRRIRENSRFH